MIENIFGNYLTDKGIVSKDALKNVLKKQDGARVKMGLMAVAEGMMTVAQADEVNRLQAVMDKRFGDIAVGKGYLTDEQVGALLKKQGNAYLSFVQAILDEGLMGMEEVEAAFDAFAAENGYSDEQKEDLKSDEPEKIIPIILPGRLGEYEKIVTTVVKTIIRMIDRHAYIGKAVSTEEFPTDKQVNQSLVGDNGLVDGFEEGDGGLLKVASVFCKEYFETIDDFALDSAGELLNCANGIYVSALSKQGTFMELMPPNYDAVMYRIKEGSICKVPVFVGDHYLNLVIASI